LASFLYRSFAGSFQDIDDDGDWDLLANVLRKASMRSSVKFAELKYLVDTPNKGFVPTPVPDMTGDVLPKTIVVAPTSAYLILSEQVPITPGYLSVALPLMLALAVAVRRMAAKQRARIAYGKPQAIRYTA